MAITFNPLTRSLDNTVEGQTISSVTSTDLVVAGEIQHEGDTDTKLAFDTNSIAFHADSAERLKITQDAIFVKDNFKLAFKAFSGENPYILSGNGFYRDLIIGSGTDSMAQFKHNGAVELYYDGVKTFETTSVGATLTGNLSMTAELNLLGGSDAARFIDSQVGDGNALHFRRITGGDAGHEDMAKFHGGGSCELYHDNVKKIETTSSGVTVTGSVTTQDMNMSNLNGSANEVDNTKGSWSLQEGANDLFLINRVNGKKYKFNLTEIN
jgi:hypothetical protein